MAGNIPFPKSSQNKMPLDHKLKNTQQLITQTRVLKTPPSPLSLPSCPYTQPPASCEMYVYLKEPRALAGSCKQMFCVISVCSSRKCLFLTPRKTTPWSKTLFLCLKKVPKQADSCKRLEIKWLLLYSPTPSTLPQPPWVTL